MAKKAKSTKSRPASPAEEDSGPGFVRIIAGAWRRRQLPYLGDRRTRPMKDRVRENLFNLIQQVVEGTHALDLFAGTGALGFEALSRGAVRATFCEQHAPAAEQIRKNAELLGAADRVRIWTGDAFRHFSQFQDATVPWLVFCSPPYEFYVSRAAELTQLLSGLFERAPVGSWFVLESDERFDATQFPWGDWDVRRYAPATVAVVEKEEAP